MKIAGIIAEYNPFHNGHQYHLEQTRQCSGADAVIVAMSGEFVQRGEPASFDKRLRARWALEAGADIVLELPTVCAVSCAQRFAQGAVATLAGTGLLTHLGFGCETDSLEDLMQCEAALSIEEPHYIDALKGHLSSGKSFPRAQDEARRACGLDPKLLRVLQNPNGVLGLEYLRALRQYAPDVVSVPILRRGAGHHDPAIQGPSASASAVRAALKAGDDRALSPLPEHVRADIESALRGGQGILTDARLSDCFLYALRAMDRARLRELPEVSEGLENALYRACREAASYEELLVRLKSKRYTLARLKRICCGALLDIDNALQKSASEDPGAQYLRVLGMKKDAKRLVRALCEAARLPVLMRGEDFESLSEKARKVFAVDERAKRICAIGRGIPCVEEMKERVLVVE
ncbi:MAG: nucleotidyltransferase family protein [Bacillota bacterium]